MLIKYKNVSIDNSSNFLKVINLQNYDTPGIKYNIFLKKNKDYIIILNSQKKTQYNSSVILNIINKEHVNILKNPIYISDENKKYFIKFNSLNNENLFINFSFINCIISDYFIINNLTLMDNFNNIIVKYNYNYTNEYYNINNINNNNDNNQLVHLPKNIKKIFTTKNFNSIDDINNNLLDCNFNNIYNDKINNYIINNINIIEDNMKDNLNNDQINKENNIRNINNTTNDVILIIIDYIYMINNLADSRYKFIDYLKENNQNIIVVGTGQKYFKPGMDILKLINLLNIKPKIIIHANNFTKNKLLVSGLSKFPCIKILIIEDMHALDTINYIIKSNNINYIFYHCDCNQLDRIKLLNRQINFINYPHFVNTKIFKDYGINKTHDIILYGCINQSVYPFRCRLFNLIQKSHKFKVLYVPFPGYYVKNKNYITTGSKLAKLINKAYIGIVTPSIHDYFLKKYLEIPSCRTMIAGNIPTRYRSLFQNNIIELNPGMSDIQIINTLLSALNNKKKLMEDIDNLQNIMVNKFSYEKGNEHFNKIINSIKDESAA